MKFNKNKRMFLAMYTAMMSAVMLTGFASSTEAQEQSAVEAEVSTEPSDQEETLDDTRFAEGYRYRLGCITGSDRCAVRDDRECEDCGS